MIVELLVRVLCGGLIIYLGYLIAFKQKIELIHSYHYGNLKDEDKAAFCKGEGIGNIITGIGVLLMSIILIFIGVGISLYTVIRYNKSLF